MRTIDKSRAIDVITASVFLNNYCCKKKKISLSFYAFPLKCKVILLQLVTTVLDSFIESWKTFLNIFFFQSFAVASSISVSAVLTVAVLRGQKKLKYFVFELFLFFLKLLEVLFLQNVVSSLFTFGGRPCLVYSSPE